MRISKELFGVALIAATALVAGHAERLDRFEVREPIPAAVFLPREGKRIACFITINSSDEKSVFTRYLNPADWDLVELTAPAANGTKAGWFDVACKKNIACDINVISGHFAGRFFGSSGYTLGLNELENHSCAQDCKGILEHPKEVYLFGCNTLATKERDHRTPQVYYRHLVDDEGYSPEVARRVTDDRYSSFGQDNRAKVQRSFSGVPYLYGFYSVSPLGKDLGPILENFMRKIGDYTAHFDSLVAKATAAKTAPNVILQSAMKGLSFSQCSGLDPNDPEYTFHLQICALFDKAIPLKDRLFSVEVMLNSEKVLALLPSIQNFMRTNIREIKLTEAAIFSRLQANQNAKRILLDTVKAVDMPITKIEWMRFAHLMGWIPREDLITVVNQLVHSAFESGFFQPDMGDVICSLNVAGVNQLDFSNLVGKIQGFHFSTESAANAMRCTGLARYPAFRKKMSEVYLSRAHLTKSDTMNLATILSETPPVTDPTEADRALLGRLRAQCDRQPLDPGSPMCGRALAKLGATDETTAAHLAALFRAGNPSMQMTYADSFHSMQVGLDLLETAVVDVYLDPRHPYWYGIERYFMIQPIRGDANQKRILGYLRDRKDGRRPDEMIYALREMRMTPAEVENNFNVLRGKPAILITSKVMMGFLELANTAGADPALFERLFREHRTVSVTNDEDLKAFYATLKLPLVRQSVRTSKVAQEAVCQIMKSAADNLGFDDYGDVVARQVPVRSCAELISEAI